MKCCLLIFFFAASFAYDPEVAGFCDTLLDESFFQHRFQFLGEGNQSTAYIDENGEFVIKVFHFKRQKPNWQDDYWRIITSDSKYSRRKRERLLRPFVGYTALMERDPDGAGLIALSLSGKKRVVQSDRGPLQIAYFVVQRLASATCDVISNALDKGDIEEAALSLEKVLALNLHHYRLGLFDNDHNIMHNTGFIAGHAIRIDAGKVEPFIEALDPSREREELAKLHRRIGSWLKRHYPRYCRKIMKRLAHSEECLLSSPQAAQQKSHQKGQALSS